MASSAVHFRAHFPPPSYTVGLARTEQDLIRCQQLRHEVSLEAGISTPTGDTIRDHRHYGTDDRHIVVTSNRDAKPVATARLSIESGKNGPSMFQCKNQFRIVPISTGPGRGMELGRICIHRDYRNIKVINTLWQGFASLIVIHKIDYVFTTVDIACKDDGEYVRMVSRHLSQHYAAPPSWRAVPNSPLPGGLQQKNVSVVLPSMLKTYLRYGAVVCGEPCWNAPARIATFLLLLERNAIHKRHYKALAEHI
jgi:hypothetical protein